MTERPTLVFAHYFGGSARSWNPLLSVLGEANETIVPDLPGFGETSPLDNLSVDAFATNLCERFGDRPWIAIGHSMGGKIALAAAAREHPTLIGVVLIAASPPTPQPITDAERRASLRAFGDRQAAERDLLKIAPGLSAELLATATDDALRSAEPAWRWWLEQGSREDISARTQGLQVPVLIISGDDDRVLGSNTAAEIRRGLPNATLHIVAGAGHMVPLEQPHAVAHLIQSFAASLSSEAL